jgi:hypothetical protein
VKKSLATLMLVLASLSAVAQDGQVATEGKMLLASNGSRLGAVYRVTGDGSAQIIVDGKMVTIPANTLSVADGKLTTSLSKADIRKLR